MVLYNINERIPPPNPHVNLELLRIVTAVLPRFPPQLFSTVM